ncbi:MAG: SPOR domain-containing protein [Betaproteobacteria bacterium]|nr:SPOR domain-containing protein [Betaproteobacteria bacterium]
MSRKNRIPRSPKRPSHSRGGTILGVFVGMILGAIIVTAAVLFFNRSDNPFSQPSSSKPAAGTPTTEPQPRDEPSAPNGASAQQTPASVAALPGKPGDRPVEKPDFTFFNTLPSGENAPPPTPAGQVQPPATAPTVQAPLDKQVYLQLESFENAVQADDLRARLLLMGLDRIITQRAQLDDGRVVHRIRVGPFTDREDLKAMRARLVSSGFNAIEVVN